MKKRDVLDPEEIRKYAWRTSLPPEEDEGLLVTAMPEETDADEGDEDESTEGDAFEGERSPEMNAFVAKGRERCNALAIEVRAAWETKGEAQVEATHTLLRKADEIGIALGAFQDHPLEGDRLAILLFRHAAKLHESERAGAANVLLWLPYASEEVNEVYVAAAQSGETALASSLEMSFGEKGDNFPQKDRELARRLAAIADDETSWTARYVAIRLLRFSHTREAYDALIRALSYREIRIRILALEALTDTSPCVLPPAAVASLLEEIADNPPPEHLIVLRDEYSRALMNAAAITKPPGGFDALERILDGDAFQDEWHPQFGEAWAIETLAQAYPERALERVSKAARSSSESVRAAAAGALAALDPAAAKPILLELAADPNRRVSAAARNAWFKVTSETCPIPEIACLDSTLLTEPPSETLLGRFAAMHNAQREARRALASVFFAEAPSREALVLLLLAVRDEDLAYTSPTNDLPENAAEWATAIVTKFGAPGALGICRQMERFADTEWATVLTKAAKAGVLHEDARETVRETCAELFLDAFEAGEDTAPWVGLLAAVGAPATLEELLVTHYLDDEWAPYNLCTLVGALPWAAKKTHVLDRARRALETLNAQHLRRALTAAGDALDPELVDIAAAFLTSASTNSATFVDGIGALVGCAQLLRRAERLTEAEIHAWLETPASPLFDAAASILRPTLTASDEAALNRALVMPDRGGRAAVAAFNSLLYGGKKVRRGPAAARILSFATPATRLEMLRCIVPYAAPRVVLPFVARELASEDVEMREHALESLHLLPPKRSERILRAALTTVTDPFVIEELKSALGEPTSASWRDDGDDW